MPCIFVTYCRFLTRDLANTFTESCSKLFSNNPTSGEGWMVKILFARVLGGDVAHCLPMCCTLHRLRRATLRQPPCRLEQINHVDREYP